MGTDIELNIETKEGVDIELNTEITLTINGQDTTGWIRGWSDNTDGTTAVRVFCPFLDRR